MAKRRKQRKGAKPRRAPEPGTFSVGSYVRVRPGTRDPDFPDTVLDGWTGDILESEREDDEVLYHIQWDQRTLNAMAAKYRDEARQRGLAVDTMWLGEEDIEAAAAVPRPIPAAARNSEEARIRTVFGLAPDEPLPDVDAESLATYHRYLGEKLIFPFMANHELWDDVSSQQIGRRVRMLGLLDPSPANAEAGLLCEAILEGVPLVAPLAALTVSDRGPARQLVADYNYWQFQGRTDVLLRFGAAGKTDLRGLLNFSLLLLASGFGCGALVGSVAASSAAAATVVESGVVLGGLLGTALLVFFGTASNRYHYDLYLRGVLGLVLGVTIGGLLGVLLTALAGTLLGGLMGGLLGWFVARTVGPRTAIFWGAGAGVLFGIIVQALWQDAAAWTGLWVGGLLGAVVVPVVALGGAYLSMALEKESASHLK